MNYKAVIFDLDGTATPDASDSVPTQAVIDAVASKKNAYRLSAATGRSWKFAKPVIEALVLKDACVVGGGSLIISPADEEILWQALIDVDSLQAILEVLISHEYEIVVSRGLEQSDLGNPSAVDGTKPVNVLYVVAVDPTDADKLSSAIHACGAVAVAKAHSWGHPGAVDLHVTPLTATKEQAVTKLLELLGVSREEAVGVGDGYNDTHLFNAVGYKVAMGNAVPELKEVADRVIGSVQEDGLAGFLSELS